jgi:Secretion system C-terminal sorting domain
LIRKSFHQVFGLKGKITEFGGETQTEFSHILDDPQPESLNRPVIVTVHLDFLLINTFNSRLSSRCRYHCSSQPTPVTMIKSIFTFVTALFLSTTALPAQCFPSPPASCFVVSQDSVFDVGGMDTGDITPHQYLVCPGRTLTYNVVSSYLIDIYVQSGGVLVMKSSQIAHIYLEQNATLRIDTTGNYGLFIQAVYYDSNIVNFIDTAQYSYPWPLFPCTPFHMFDYSNFAGGISPCGAATDVTMSQNEMRPVMYPNPSSGIIQFTGLNAQGSSMEIYNTTGAMVLQGRAHVNESVDVTLLPAGLYLIRIGTGKENQVLKLLKE